MMKPIKIRTILAGMLVTGVMFSSTPVIAQGGNYQVKDLLQPCREGDNDSRGGQLDELECEQYINGVVDTIALTRDLRRSDICLPSLNKRPDDVRRAFVKWAYDNHDQRNEPAAKGVLRTLKTKFSCNK